PGRSAESAESTDRSSSCCAANGLTHGRGMVPVVKSYPQASQNSASGTFSDWQFGQATVAGAGPPDGCAGADAAAGPGPGVAPVGSSIGAPQTAQSSADAGGCPSGQVL